MTPTQHWLSRIAAEGGPPRHGAHSAKFAPLGPLGDQGATPGPAEGVEAQGDGNFGVLGLDIRAATDLFAVAYRPCGCAVLGFTLPISPKDRELLQKIAGLPHACLVTRPVTGPIADRIGDGLNE